MTKTLILGYGNPDREDDGVSWHIMVRVLKKQGREAPRTYQEEFAEDGKSPDFHFELQLVPEFAETISQYDYICFVDAHTGNIPDNVCFQEVTPLFQASPFTHHMTPSTCLSIAETLYGACPKAYLLSARGYNFEFMHSLSPETDQYADQAAQILFDWLQTLE